MNQSVEAVQVMVNTADFDFSLIQGITLGFLTLLIPLGFEVFRKTKQEYMDFGTNSKDYADVFDVRILNYLLDFYLFGGVLMAGLLFPILWEVVSVTFVGNLNRIMFIIWVIVLTFLFGSLLFRIGKFVLSKEFRHQVMLEILDNETDKKKISDFWKTYWRRDRTEEKEDQLMLDISESKFWDTFVLKVNQLFKKKEYKELSEMLRVFLLNFDKRKEYIWESSEFIKQIFDWRLLTWDYFKRKGVATHLWHVDHELDQIGKGIRKKSLTESNKQYAFFDALQKHFEENKKDEDYIKRILGRQVLPEVWDIIGNKDDSYLYDSAFPEEWKWWGSVDKVILGWIRASALNHWKKNPQKTSIMELLLDSANENTLLGEYFFLAENVRFIVNKNTDSMNVKRFFNLEESTQYPINLGIVTSGNDEGGEDKSARISRMFNERYTHTLKTILSNPLEYVSPTGGDSKWICEHLDEVIKAFDLDLVKEVAKEKEYWEYRRKYFMKLLKDLQKQQEKNKEIDK